jgi:hypothetical protein
MERAALEFCLQVAQPVFLGAAVDIRLRSVRPICEAAFVLARPDPGRRLARKGLYPPKGIAAGAGRHQ